MAAAPKADASAPAKAPSAAPVQAKPTSQPSSETKPAPAGTPLAATPVSPATTTSTAKTITKPLVAGERIEAPQPASGGQKAAEIRRESAAKDEPPAPPKSALSEPAAEPQPQRVTPEPTPDTGKPARKETTPAPVEAIAAKPEPEPEHAPEWSPPEQHYPWRPSLFIVHITPELAPVAKVGGLADVVFGLCREMEHRGNHVEIILPKYDCMRYDHIWGLQCTFDDLWVPWYGGAVHCSVYFGFVHGRKCFFIEPHSQDNFFNRGAVYGFKDDVLRFAFFSRAAMEFLWKSGKNPDVIHCHDWQTALVPVFLFEIYQRMGLWHPRVCYTIHNFKHQGVTGAEVLNATGLNRPDYYLHYDRLRDNNNQNAVNLMKGGIVYSNFVTTVSPRYAAEVKDEGQGFGLEPTLHIHHMKYGGVVNGVDYEVWNPEIDPLIPVHYSADTLDRKYDNKRALRGRLLLADNEKPIVAFVGRLDPQKGIELIRHSLFFTLAQGGQFVLLGSSPDNSINAYFWGLKHQFNDNPDVHLEIGYNEELAHLIYAGSDITVVPSRFEPCGLIQLIAMRYGTVPVVREVGGLADTVIDKDFSHRPLHERNGYLFRDYDEAGLESALGRAIACYYQFPDHFRELMKNGMRFDYSWNHPGQDYLNIYDLIREK
ncbi:MAG: glycogen synthase GlgA [Methylococcaceae bacterium]|nr:glycogen synthase GlgA [Methylococcaceae bacterium]